MLDYSVEPNNQRFNSTKFTANVFIYFFDKKYWYIYKEYVPLHIIENQNRN